MGLQDDLKTYLETRTPIGKQGTCKVCELSPGLEKVARKAIQEGAPLRYVWHWLRTQGVTFSETTYRRHILEGHVND